MNWITTCFTDSWKKWNSRFNNSHLLISTCKHKKLIYSRCCTLHQFFHTYKPLSVIRAIASTRQIKALGSSHVFWAFLLVFLLKRKGKVKHCLTMDIASVIYSIFFLATEDTNPPPTCFTMFSSPASHTHFVPIFITGEMTKCVVSGKTKFCATLSVVVFVTDHPDPVADSSCGTIVRMSLPGLVRKNCTTLSCSVNHFTVAYKTQHG